MTAQQGIVCVLVLACSGYALWTLMPTAARRFLATRLQHLPLGPRLQATFTRAAAATSGCDCSGCDKVVDRTPKGQPQVIRFQAKPKI